ncbi:MAG TPA: polysaccharide deacetylase family protein [Pyrinomonadaceae bacterium]|nr:polysaccharide deacetylase family protein [Pyrinomonadaceae bacterium]
MIPPVLLYHKLDSPPPDAKLRGPYTPPQRFARQMLYLKKRGFSFRTASELVEHYRDHGRFPEKAVTITFDDGWRDNYTNGFPIFRELDIRPTIFLVASCVGSSSVKAVAEGESAREHLTADQVREMSDWGVEFGSHTMNHAHLDRIPIDEASLEIAGAKTAIEDLTQKPCKTLAYPAGFFNDEVKDIAAAAGHTAAFTTSYGKADKFDLFELNRIEVLRRHLFLFQFRSNVLGQISVRAC